MFTIERRVGRLIEMRVVGAADFVAFGKVIALANEVGPDAQVVVCADVRRGNLVTPEQAAKIATIIRGTRTRLACSITLVGDNVPLERTVNRVAQQADPDFVETVRTPEEVVSRLTPLLNPAELARLKLFLAEGA